MVDAPAGSTPKRNIPSISRLFYNPKHQPVKVVLPQSPPRSTPRNQRRATGRTPPRPSSVQRQSLSLASTASTRQSVPPAAALPLPLLPNLRRTVDASFESPLSSIGETMFNSGPNSDETMDRNFQTENLAVNMGDAGRPQSQLGLASLWASAMGEPLSTTTNGPSVKRAPSSPSRPAPAKTHPPNNGFSTRATTAAVTTEVATQTGNSAAAIAGKRGTEGELVNPTAEINNDGTNEEGIDDPEQSAETLSRLATIQTEQKALAKRFSDVIVESAKSEWKKQKHAASVARKAWEEAGKVLKEAETQEELKREYWQAAEKYETSMGTTEQLYCVFKKAAEKLNK